MTDLGGYIDRVIHVCDRLDIPSLNRACEQITEVLASGRQLFIAGNGGSAVNASHWANDLRAAAQSLHWFPVHVQSLTSNIAQVTALANDEGYENIFARGISASARAGDLLIVISASGNSSNIIKGIEAAKERGLRTLGFLGMGGGKARELCDHAVVVPSDEYGQVEDVHLICNHAITNHIRSLRHRTT